MNIVGKSAAVAGSAGLLAGGLAIVGESQAQAASGVGRLTIDSVTANNTQENVDEIFLKLGDKRFRKQRGHRQPRCPTVPDRHPTE